MSIANEPAFPEMKHIGADEEHGWPISYQGGLTKREYFAARAMQGLLSEGKWRGIAASLYLKLVERSVTISDALIAELEKE